MHGENNSNLLLVSFVPWSNKNKLSPRAWQALLLRPPLIVALIRAYCDSSNLRSKIMF